jgi:hyperosmotically inducible protein
LLQQWFVGRVKALERKTDMRKNRVLDVALSAALILSSGVMASAQSGGSNQAATANDQQQMIHVLPGVKQTITGTDRQQVQIAREVRHELAMLPYYSIFDDLQYSVNGSTVTLGGKVITLGLKRDAENAAKGVEGVTNVVNKIEELPPSSQDQQLRLAVARRIFSFGNLSRYSWEASPTIHIILKGGHVFLEGVVDTQQDKDAAGIQANGVSGIFSVENNLQVVGKGKS